MSTRHDKHSAEFKLGGRDFSAGYDERLRHSEIAERAYSLWEQRGYPQGTADEDWLEAEQQYQSSELVNAG